MPRPPIVAYLHSLIPAPSRLNHKLPLEFRMLEWVCWLDALTQEFGPKYPDSQA